MNLPVWITGANGLIGNYLVQTASRFAPRWRVGALKCVNFDLPDFAALEREFQNDRTEQRANRPRVLIGWSEPFTVYKLPNRTES